MILVGHLIGLQLGLRIHILIICKPSLLQRLVIDHRSGVSQNLSIKYRE